MNRNRWYDIIINIIVKTQGSNRKNIIIMK